MYLWYRLKDKLFDFKMRCQRFKRGYADIDVWSIDLWFLEKIVPMLKQLRDHHCGYPGTEEVPTDEKWCEILDEMIFCFTEGNEDTCSQKNEYENTFTTTRVEVQEGEYTRVTFHHEPEENHQKYLKRLREIGEYQKNMQQKGLKLFAKYFNQLWD